VSDLSPLKAMVQRGGTVLVDDALKGELEKLKR
jgi:hypothetical protein